MAFVVGLVFATLVAVAVAVAVAKLTSHRSNLTREREWQRTAIVQRPSEGPPFDVDLDAGVVRIRPTSPNDPVA